MPGFSFGMDRPPTRQNHYVPIWYQKGFIVGPKTSRFFLDLDPTKTALPDGRVTAGCAVSSRAPKSCFWSEDLYTTRFGSAINDEVERYLFGAIDNYGASAVRAFASIDLATIHKLFQRFFEYLDAQILRTPKGLDWIKSKYPYLTQLDLMLEMQGLRQMHCTMWYESVREIVSAEQSDVKFIVTDHPVTVYNAACPPASLTCQYPNDPPIELKGTIFALDADHCLILSNLEYARNPNRIDLKASRTNARYYGQSIARTDAFVRSRKLSSEEVNSINHVLKARATRYIPASEKDWLYPERLRLGTWEADVLLHWQHLHTYPTAAREPIAPSVWTPLVERIQTTGFPLEANPQVVFQLRITGKLNDTRIAFRRIANFVRAQGDKAIARKAIKELAGAFQSAKKTIRRKWQTLESTGTPPMRFRGNVEVSIPKGGFERNTVRRLILTFGRGKQVRAMPLAMLVKVEPADSSLPGNVNTRTESASQGVEVVVKTPKECSRDDPIYSFGSGRLGSNLPEAPRAKTIGQRG